MFLDQVLLRTAGSGWYANDVSERQTATDTEVYWVQVSFLERKKVFLVEFQQDWNGGSGEFWVKYGESIDSLQPYVDTNQDIKVCFYRFTIPFNVLC